MTGSLEPALATAGVLVDAASSRGDDHIALDLARGMRQMSASWKCARMIAGGYVLVVAVSLSPSSETVTFTGPAGAVARLSFRP